jgi:hypothetical protein
MYLIGPFITSILNRDVIYVGDRILPAVGYYDAVSAMVSQFLLVVPFFLGRQFLRASGDTEETFRVIVLAGLLYSLPILVELRMSPQLSNWIYGYSTSFIVEFRYGGYRPVVFLQNGLATSFFLMTAVVAAATLWRAKSRIGPSSRTTVATAYLGAILVLCKSAGALLYGIVLVPLVWLSNLTVQRGTAIVCVTVALLYPSLRAADLFPNAYLAEIAASVNQERADSLKTRFDQEEQLLKHASDRFFFGWGRFGRSRVYDESGSDVSLTDGGWIITMGQFGFFGFVAEFGLLSLPVMTAFFAFRFAETNRDKIFLGALMLIIAVTVLEQLPNASVSSWTWLLVGSLSGRSEALRLIARQRKPHRGPPFGRPHNRVTKPGI